MPWGRTDDAFSCANSRQDGHPRRDQSGFGPSHQRPRPVTASYSALSGAGARPETDPPDWAAELIPLDAYRDLGDEQPDERPASHQSQLYHALTLAAAGWPVFPLHRPVDGRCDCRRTDCASPGKHPRTQNGLQDATTDAGTIRAFWRRWPEANIGLAVPTGYVVVDIDVDDPTTVLGSRPLPPTATARTGRGWHFLYRTKDAIRPRVGVREHVDLRGPGSYIVAPPSVHVSGRRYEWVEPPENGIAEVPAWVIDASPSHAASDRTDDGGVIAEGRRNDTLTTLAGAMRRRWATPAEIEAALLRANADRCRPPLASAEVHAIAVSVGRYPPAEPPPTTTPAPIWAEPEDRGLATKSDLGSTEYVEDIGRPGRIVVFAAEEGTGKSTSATELGVRVATAGGSFAGTWSVLVNGPVLYLSEMHPDDDYDNEAMVLEALHLDRSALAGCYYRLNLMTAAGGKPALMDAEWRSRVIGWLKARSALLAIFDTATGATRVDPWGAAIQEVYANLRMMLAEYPELLVVLVVHLKKPKGHGARGLDAVLGEWGRWNDATILMENDGPGFDRAKITVRKRVRKQRRIIVSKLGGLLIDPRDVTTTGPKVPAEKIVAAVTANPGATYAQLAAILEVSSPTVASYVKALSDRLTIVPGAAKSGPGRANRVYLADSVAKSQNIAKHGPFAMDLAMDGDSSQIAKRSLKGNALPFAIDDHRDVDEDLAELATDDDAESWS